MSCQLWALQIAQAFLDIPEPVKEGTTLALDESPYVSNSEIQHEIKLNEAQNVRRYKLLSSTARVAAPKKTTAPPPHSSTAA
jgi:hypothetical protein